MVSSICFFVHPYLGKWSNLTISYFSNGLSWNHQLGKFGMIKSHRGLLRSDYDMGRWSCRDAGRCMCRCVSPKTSHVPCLSHRIHGTGIFTSFGWVFMVNVGKYAIHGWYGFEFRRRYRRYRSKRGTLSFHSEPWACDLRFPWLMCFSHVMNIPRIPGFFKSYSFIMFSYIHVKIMLTPSWFLEIVIDFGMEEMEV